MAWLPGRVVVPAANGQPSKKSSSSQKGYVVDAVVLLDDGVMLTPLVGAISASVCFPIT